MTIRLSVGPANVQVELPLSEQQVVVLEPKDQIPTRDWEELTVMAMSEPLGTKPLGEHDLKDKKIAIMVDDWGRPTPAWKFIPALLEVLHRAGARTEDITFITASGMHDTMTQEEMERKVGKETVAKYRCISHDGGDRENLVFCGFTDLGTPIWVNRWVAEADFKIACGRVYPHPAFGYEGGYKMILPGVASYETIVRDHAFNFSPLSDYGIMESPSRQESDAVGRIVGIEFLINYVMNKNNEPVMAFGGVVELAHRKAVAYGDRHVWGVELGELRDVVIACSASAKDGVDHYAVTMAAKAVRPGGTVIMVVQDESKAPISNDLHDMDLSDLVLLHEKRDYAISEPDIQWRLKAVRGEVSRRRLYFGSDKKFVFVGGRVSDRTLALTGAAWYPTIEAAFTESVPEPSGVQVVVLPEADKTLPLIAFHSE